MFIKTTLLVLVCAAAFAAANPAVGVEWRWKPRHMTVSPNVMGLPYKKMMKYYEPVVFIPGNKVVDNCGKAATAEELIVGGSEANAHEFPWQVALFINDMFFCGGSLISEEWVLTAAHCAEMATSIEVVAGAHNLKEDEPTQVTVMSTEFILHEQWSHLTAENDIALVKLPTPIERTPEIRPVCLPEWSDIPLEVGSMVNITGWGQISDSIFGITDKLRQVTVPVIENSVCSETYGSSIQENIVCTDGSDGLGSCSGDSGGPLSQPHDCDCDSCIVVRGIVSFGASAGCEAGYPSAFTRVANYLEWIETNTGIIIDP